MTKPIVIITLSYIGGIIIGGAINLPLWLPFIVAGFLIIFTLGCILRKVDCKLLIVFLFLLLGLINISFRSPTPFVAQTKVNSSNAVIKITMGIRERLMKNSHKTLPKPYGTLLNSIIFGSASAKTPFETKEIYRRAGVSHLLVASGMHLAILIGVCLFVVRSARLPLWLGVVIVSAVNLFYAVMVGLGPSILRAAIMAEIMLLGLLFEKEKDVFVSAALAAFIILLFNPRCLFYAGFELSFAATFSLIYISPIINSRLRTFMPKAIASLLSIAIAPVLACAPLTIFHFSRFSAVGVFTNILVLPLAGAIIVLGFMSSLLSLLFLPAATLINSSNLILLILVHFTVARLAALPFAQIYLGAPKIPLLVAYYLGLIGFVYVLQSGKFPKMNKFRLLVLVFGILSVILWDLALSFKANGLNITVLNVGEGDSIFIECPNKKILVDGGTRWMGKRMVIPYLLKKGVNKLDLVILTHPHSDHVGGLNEILEKFKVDEVLHTGVVYESQAYRRFLGLIKKNSIKYHLAQAGQKIKFDENIEGLILHPKGGGIAKANSGINNLSIVFRLQYDDFSMLFAGDCEQEGEENILSTFPDSLLSSTVLKVGHHGSNSSTTALFLSAVNPEVSVISCGKNNQFGHPHPETLQKLKGVKVYRTDQDGTIVIKSDGERFSVLPGLGFP
ncbi:MAG: DNA internalization-related competence protein ComEC/Rec2 [Candidatus Saganbacteria bacterium]|nr:DNA internalization-related competence protein ComEC/Rec2 [Candidatus Saganbacteria bacterium]